MFEGLYLAKVNEDGSYGAPVKLEVVVDITPITTSDDLPEVTMPSFTGEISFEMPMDYKAIKNFVWAILNLKRSEKHLVSKNIWCR